ncbi:MAG: hypothetical protein G5703_08270 [Serratia symbiotica]|nr:hypothetical protein [Serratia symbiotica]
MTALFILFIICFWCLFKRLKSFLHLGVAACRERSIMRPIDPVFRQIRRRISKGKVKQRKSQNNGLTLQGRRRNIIHPKLAAGVLRLAHRSLIIYQTICVGTPQDDIPSPLGQKISSLKE